MWSTSLCSHGSGRCRVPGMWAHLGADLTPIIFSISRAVPRVALPSTFSPPESTALRRLCSRTSPTGLQASVSYVTAVSAHIYSCFCARWTCGSLNPLLGISNEQSRGSTLPPARQQPHKGGPSWVQAQEVPWTWTAEELTWEAALPFSLVSWLIHSLGFPRCCSTVCTGVLPLAVLWGKLGRPRESSVTFLPGAGLCVFLAIQPLLCNISPRQDKAPVSQ